MPRRSRGRRIAAILIVGAFGCGPSPSSKAPTPSEAAALLEEALASWKRGDAPKVLQSRDPPLKFTDADRFAGRRLEDYQVGPTPEPHDYVVEFPVKLRLRGRRGKAVERDAVYQVLTQPSPAVLRNDPE